MRFTPLTPRASSSPSGVGERTHVWACGAACAVAAWFGLLWALRRVVTLQLGDAAGLSAPILLHVALAAAFVVVAMTSMARPSDKH